MISKQSILRISNFADSVTRRSKECSKSKEKEGLIFQNAGLKERMKQKSYSLSQLAHSRDSVMNTNVMKQENQKTNEESEEATKS